MDYVAVKTFVSPQRTIQDMKLRNESEKTNLIIIKKNEQNTAKKLKTVSTLNINTTRSKLVLLVASSCTL